MASDAKPAASRLRRIALAVLAAVAFVVLLGAWLAGTGSGARAALSVAGMLTGGSLDAQGVTGRLAGPLHIERLTLTSPDSRAVLSDVRLEWRPTALLRGLLHVDFLRAGHLLFEGQAMKDPEPARLPAGIALPFDLQLQELALRDGEIRRGSDTLATLGPLTLQLDFDGNRYLLTLPRLAAGIPLKNGQLSADVNGSASLSARRPYAIDGRFASKTRATVEQRTLGANGTVRLTGSLEQLETLLDLTIGNAGLNGTLILHPFAESPLGRSQLAGRAVDLSQLDPRLPATALDLQMVADENGSGTLDFTNGIAGAYDTGKLPLHALHVTFRQDKGRVMAERISASLGTASQPAGTVTGQGSMQDDTLALRLVTEALNLKRIDRRARTTKLAGNVELKRSGGRQEIRVSLSEPLEREQRLTLEADALLSADELNLRRAELRAGSGRADVSGRLALTGKQAFLAQGKIDSFRLRELGAFSRFPDLELNAGFSVRGAREPRLEADLSYRITDSRLAGQPLSGNGEARLRGEHLEIPGLNLVSGANRLQAEGRLTGDDARLAFALDAPQLGQLGPAFGGSVKATGTVRGTLSQPRIDAEWTANAARVPGGLRIDRMQGKAQVAIDRKRALPLDNGTATISAAGLHFGEDRLGSLDLQLRFSPQPDAPLELLLRVQDIASSRLQARQFTASGKGSTGAHTIDLTLEESRQGWAIRTAGGLAEVATAPRWKGQLLSLDAKGRFNARLASPAPLLLSAERMQLENFLLDADSIRLAVDLFSRDASGIATRGRIERLQLGRLLAQADPPPPIRTDLELGGDWNIRITDNLTGTLALRRERGDLTVLANAPVTLGLSTLAASAAASNGRLTVNMQAIGQRLGRIDLAGGTSIGNNDNRLAIAPDAPLMGNVRIDVPSLAWIAPLLSPTMSLDGNLQGDVSLNGNIDQPRIAGRITGNALRVALPDQGLDLRQGTLDSEFQGNRWLVRALNFQGEEGRISLSGPVDFGGGGIAAQITLLAERFALLNRSDRRIVISGASELNWKDNQGKATGTFTVNSGFIDLGSADKPRLSDDVVIVGREKEHGVNKTVFDADITVALGDGVVLKGRGLDALLTGQVRLLGSAGETLQAQGIIQVAKGTYAAYGRELAIEQGLLRFRGPLNNPSLDILAMRRGQEVEAGVSIRGTALTPRVTLVSEPPVPDADKLSWLVLGRGLASAGDTDVGSLQSAAGALLSAGAKAGVQSRIASTFGLDTFSVGTSQDTLQQRIVTIGKQVSSRLYLSYQQGLESAGSVVQVRYTLSPKLSLEAEAGSRSAISLFYNIAFD